MTFEEAKSRVALAIATLEKRGHGGLTLDELKGVYGAVWGQQTASGSGIGNAISEDDPSHELTAEQLLAALPPTATELPDNE